VVRRAAFTLIELIFAIVIIAISVLSLPMMNQAVSKGIDSNIVQEAIFAAATKLNEALSTNWDENSIETNTTNTYARVIEATTGQCDANRRMPGHINQPLHRRCLDDSTVGVANSNTNADVDALDDMEHGDQDIFVDTTAEAAGYKDSYTYAMSVTHPATFGPTSNSNIKEISITVKDSTPKTVVNLKTYSCNIGEVDYYSRSY
jgi:prepilin-type N-terminal cleavage/methylation domain-containing protein